MIHCPICGSRLQHLTEKEFMDFFVRLPRIGSRKPQLLRLIAENGPIDSLSLMELAYRKEVNSSRLTQDINQLRRVTRLYGWTISTYGPRPTTYSLRKLS